MARIILAVGSHPNESEVTGWAAAGLLKEDLQRRGHQVEIHPVPEEHTIQGKAKELYEKNETVYFPENFDNRTAKYLRNLAERRKDAFVI